MSRKIVIGVFVSIFILSFLVVAFQKNSFEKTLTVSSRVRPEPLSHADLVSRLSSYFPASQLTIDTPEKDIVELPGYLPLSAKKSHNGQAIVTSYITDCSQDLWDFAEDNVDLPPGITKIERCHWNIRTFIHDKNGSSEITFQCNEDIPQWHFVPQAKAGSWNAQPLVLGWSPGDKKIVASIEPIGCYFRETSPYAIYDIENKSWTFAPYGSLSGDLGSILITTKNDKNIPSCEEGHTIGQYLTPNMVALWDIESSNGKILFNKDMSFCQILSVDWSTRTSQIKQFKMDRFVINDPYNEATNKKCIDGQYDYNITSRNINEIPFEVFTIKW
jgi:hypothetical protein